MQKSTITAVLKEARKRFLQKSFDPEFYEAKAFIRRKFKPVMCQIVPSEIMALLTDPTG